MHLHLQTALVVAVAARVLVPDARRLIRRTLGLGVRVGAEEIIRDSSRPPSPPTRPARVRDGR